MKSQKRLTPGCSILFIGCTVILFVSATITGELLKPFIESIARPPRQNELIIEPHTIISPATNLHLQWIWSEIQVAAGNSLSVEIIADQGQLGILGVVNTKGQREMMILDGMTSQQVLWRVVEESPYGDPSVFALHRSTLYVGFSGGTGKVAAYGWKTGKELWRHRAIGGRTMSFINADSEYVYVLTENGRFRLRADTGAKTWTSGESENYREKILTEDMIYQIEYGPGSPYVKGLRAIDRITGENQWTNDKVISSIAVSDQAIFAIAENNHLLSLDPMTGQERLSVQFDQPAFQQKNSISGVETYHVAIDEQTRMLYVFLGDSRQLFAFEILPEAE